MREHAMHHLSRRLFMAGALTAGVSLGLARRHGPVPITTRSSASAPTRKCSVAAMAAIK